MGSSWCPAHDPLILAGFLICGECDEVSYPVDAEWIDVTQILVAFEQAHAPRCPHQRQPHLVLVDTMSADQSVPLVPQPRRCKGTVGSGPRRDQPCRNPAAAWSRYCAHHDPARKDVPR